MIAVVEPELEGDYWRNTPLWWPQAELRYGWNASSCLITMDDELEPNMSIILWGSNARLRYARLSGDGDNLYFRHVLDRGKGR